MRRNMTETILKRQYITDADGTPVGVILPIEEFALVQHLLETKSPAVKETEPDVQELPARRPIRDAAFFGIWADRQDMQGQSTRDWLETQRNGQWSRQ
jgi:hypothetical protein